jgi:hypothetical protein
MIIITYSAIRSFITLRFGIIKKQDLVGYPSWDEILVANVDVPQDGGQAPGGGVVGQALDVHEVVQQNVLYPTL